VDNANVLDLLTACHEKKFWGTITLQFQNGVLTNAQILQNLKPQMCTVAQFRPEIEAEIEEKRVLIFEQA
jgi:hypothetical protein